MSMPWAWRWTIVTQDTTIRETWGKGTWDLPLCIIFEMFSKSIIISKAKVEKKEMMLFEEVIFKVQFMSSELISLLVALPAAAAESPMNFPRVALCQPCQLLLQGFGWLSLQRSASTSPAVAPWTPSNVLKQSSTRCCRCDSSTEGVSFLLPLWST